MKENLIQYWTRVRDNAEVALNYADSQLQKLGHTATFQTVDNVTYINDGVAQDIGESKFNPGDDAA